MFNLSKKKEQKSIRQVAVENLTDLISDYAEWYHRAGLYLPPAYAADPTGWSEALQKIERAFDLVSGNDDDYTLAQFNAETGLVGDLQNLEDLEKEINEGFALFGANLLYLTDIKKSEVPTH